MAFNRIARAVPGALVFASLAPAAWASCGSAFCTVNTNLLPQIPLTEPGTRLDARFEYIDQNQPRHGNRDVSVGEIPRHHDEVETINRNLLLTLGHNFDEHWGFTATLPLINREHEHIHNHRGEKLLETWNFTQPGDLRLLGRYQLQGEHPSNVYGLVAGVKLPSGSISVQNAESAVAERSLQPGTGTTDGLIGGFWNDTLPIPDSGWFTQLLAQAPFYKRNGFRPGYTVGFDLGYNYQPLPELALILQLNTVRKGRDTGSEAEPEDSGGWTVSLSPGISYGVFTNTDVYGFVQVPLYRYVNGVQLTANWSVVVGVSTRF
ncbi:MAG: hypothetical protein AB7H71_06615 [Alphaproteobacteria bacterium]